MFFPPSHLPKPSTILKHWIPASPDTHFVWQNASGQRESPPETPKYTLRVPKIPKNVKVMWQCFTLMWHFLKSDVTLLHFDVTFFQKWCDIASLWCDISADKLPCIFKTKEFFVNLWTTKKPSRNWYASLKTWDISKYHLAFHCL